MPTQYSGFTSESFFFLWEVISVDKEKTPTVVNEQGVNVKKNERRQICTNGEILAFIECSGDIKIVQL